MNRSACYFLLLLCAALAALGSHAADAPVRFAVYDLYIDPRGEPLAAYQVAINASRGNVKFISVEGGAHGEFQQPPHYDPRAIQKATIILAALSTAPGQSLPHGSVRVASLHVQIEGAAPPEFKLKLQRAANPLGQSITAHLSLRKRPHQD